MPIVSIPTKAVDKLVELETKARETEHTWDIAYRHGFVEGLRAVCPDAVGLIIMEADCIIEGEPGLPRLTITREVEQCKES